MFISLFLLLFFFLITPSSLVIYQHQSPWCLEDVNSKGNGFSKLCRPFDRLVTCPPPVLGNSWSLVIFSLYVFTTICCVFMDWNHWIAVIAKEVENRIIRKQAGIYKKHLFSHECLEELWLFIHSGLQRLWYTQNIEFTLNLKICYDWVMMQWRSHIFIMHNISVVGVKLDMYLSSGV